MDSIHSWIDKEEVAKLAEMLSPVSKGALVEESVESDNFALLDKQGQLTERVNIRQSSQDVSLGSNLAIKHQRNALADASLMARASGLTQGSVNIAPASLIKTEEETEQVISAKTSLPEQPLGKHDDQFQDDEEDLPIITKELDRINLIDDDREEGGKKFTSAVEMAPEIFIGEDDVIAPKKAQEPTESIELSEDSGNDESSEMEESIRPSDLVDPGEVEAHNASITLPSYSPPAITPSQPVEITTKVPAILDTEQSEPIELSEPLKDIKVEEAEPVAAPPASPDDVSYQYFRTDERPDPVIEEVAASSPTEKNTQFDCTFEQINHLYQQQLDVDGICVIDSDGDVLFDSMGDAAFSLYTANTMKRSALMTLPVGETKNMRLKTSATCWMHYISAHTTRGVVLVASKHKKPILAEDTERVGNALLSELNR